MPDILLATLNAKFIHAAFGLRYLFANLGDLQPRAAIAEFDINQKPVEIAEAILARNPRILGLGIYIWNVRPATELVAILKRARPELVIVLGGPEVSYETEEQEIVQLADHVITGEADLKFAEVCRALLDPVAADVRRLHSASKLPASEEAGRRESQQAGEPDSHPPALRLSGLPKVIPSDLPDPNRLALPYDYYDQRDVAHRIIYVEASRGCPFTCEFCLSSLDIPVRQFPLDRFLDAMQRLLDRGVMQFKFVDRTFNLHLPTSTAILKFFLDRWRPGMFVHFEMVPDRLPDQLRELIAQFPPGGLQFEVGIQTLNPEVEQFISRRQNHAKLDDNFHWLRERSGVHIHADLIVGLPGESLESFAAGFDRLLTLRPQEIQVGILKRLRGTPIVRHDREWAMVYSPHAPFEVLQTKLLDFATLARLRRFASFWDIYGNSGNFNEALPLLWHVGQAASLPESPRERGQLARSGGFTTEASDNSTTPEVDSAAAGRLPALPSPFWSFLAFSDWLHERGVKTSGIALTRQYELLWEFLTVERHLGPASVADPLYRDYVRSGRNDTPSWLTGSSFAAGTTKAARQNLPRRQARHLIAAESKHPR